MTALDLSKVKELHAGNEASALALVKAYFGKDGSPGNEGEHFHTLGHDWRDERFIDVITAADVLSLATLNAMPSAGAVVELLGAEVQASATALLRDIPVALAIADAEAASFAADDAPGSKLWRLLRDVNGVGTTITSKLIARKRPLLFPIHDTVVGRVIGHENTLGFWNAMRETVLANNGEVYHRAEALREAGGLGEEITPLRVIDVVLWRVGKGSKS
jgi:hypothetical protein